MNRLNRATAAVACTTALAAATITLGSVGAASGDDGRHAVQFALTVTDPNAAQAFPGDFSRCHFSTSDPFVPCVVPFTPQAGFDGAISGDLQGTQHTADEFWLGVLVGFTATTLDFPVIDIEPFEVTVAGCGVGSFVLRREGNQGSPNSTWQIVPNSGRGDLVGISGSGTAASVFNGPGGFFVDNFVGRIRCGKHHDD
jgi:Protein of unknown function (DUF3224)